MKVIKNYKETKKYRDSFNELADKTFGINFERWFRAGEWNDAYTCYSLVDDEDHVVSNVSTSSYNMMLNGEAISVVQIGTVMTEEEHRKKGYAKQLMDIALEEHKASDLIFLYGDQSAVEFYRRFGFDTSHESCGTIMLKGSYEKKHAMRKLDIDNDADFDLLRRINHNRVILSNECDGMNAEHISMFHGMYLFPDHLYYIEGLETIIYMTKRDDQVNLYGVVSARKVPFSEVIAEVIDEKTKKVKCSFSIPAINEEIEYELVDYDGDEFFIMKKDHITFPEIFHFPYIFKA